MQPRPDRGRSATGLFGVGGAVSESASHQSAGLCADCFCLPPPPSGQRIGGVRPLSARGKRPSVAPPGEDPLVITRSQAAAKDGAHPERAFYLSICADFQKIVTRIFVLRRNPWSKSLAGFGKKNLARLSDRITNSPSARGRWGVAERVTLIESKTSAVSGVPAMTVVTVAIS